MLRYLSDDKNLAEAVHSARFYKKLRRHYNEDLTDSTIYFQIVVGKIRQCLK